MFGCILSKSILTSRIDFGRSENFLLFVKITFKGITKHKSLYLTEITYQIPLLIYHICAHPKSHMPSIKIADKEPVTQLRTYKNVGTR